MSVTTVLVPVLQSEADALLAGEACPELLERARRIRTRTDRLDAIREELHGVLFEEWERSRRSAAPQGLLTRLFARKEPPRIPSGYDPYVHVFGRSFPVVGDSSKSVAQRVTELLAADEESFSRAIASDLRALHARAAELYDRASGTEPNDLEASITAQRQRISAALAGTPPRVREAYDALVVLSAWSWPVWRLDGVMLGDLVRLLGVTTQPARATLLFEDLKEQRPELETQLETLPVGLENFAGAGGYWSSTDVKTVAGSLRLYRSKLAQNAVTNGEDPEATLRQLRLLEEAVLFCEAESLGLAEAAGVEWHDRPRIADQAKNTRATS